MSKRNKYDDGSIQLSLFSQSEPKQSAQIESTQIESAQIESAQIESAQIESAQIESTQIESVQIESAQIESEINDLDLFLPLTYEEILEDVNQNSVRRSRLPDLIVPVTEFEEKIIQVVADIRNSGFLLFLYGASGVGKSTFINSLKFRKHISIKEIKSINTTELTNASELIEQKNYGLKLKKLLDKIREEATSFFSENNKNDDKLCITIDYLESVNEEDQSHVNAFFRDLNGLLRKYAILIIWPVTVHKDLDDMQKFANSFSSTMFHRTIPIINFTGPPLEEYKKIVKKTIEFFHDGKTCYDFQLHDQDFEGLENSYRQKPQEKHLIRDYLKDVKGCWEERIGYVSLIADRIPKPTEIWFIFAYPEAEMSVSSFARRIPEKIDEMWNATYNALSVYISENNQRKADWPDGSGRLTLALNSQMLTTKIMYLPTNAFIRCVASYSKEAGIKISRKDFLDENKYNVPQHWFGKSVAKDTLKRTPLCLQLSRTSVRPGKRKSGSIRKALNNAQQAFTKLNKDINEKRISDRCLNKAVCLALQDIFNDQPNFHFQSESKHPYLNIRPDILIDTTQKLICLEFCYTIDNTPGQIADYVLRKLNVYMKQLESHFGISEDLFRK